MIPTLEWTSEGVRFLDQTAFLSKRRYVLAKTYQEVADIITAMVVRGAPAIGVSAAMGVALGARPVHGHRRASARGRGPRHLRDARRHPAHRRQPVLGHRAHARRPPSSPPPGATDRTEMQGASWPKPSDVRRGHRRLPGAWAPTAQPCSREGAVLTHCNAGALATAGYGTALGVIRAAVERGQGIDVFADETRPFLQGARLTAWELVQDGIPTTVITDNMAGHFMRHGKIDAVIVGADRIAANGDVANKIGTYGVAVLAKEHGIPFYVAAPVVHHRPRRSPTATQIPIEERDAATRSRTSAASRSRPTGVARLQSRLRRHAGQLRHRHHHRARRRARPVP